MEALEKAEPQPESEQKTEESSRPPAGSTAVEGALSLAGLSFFLVDIQAKRIVWLESQALDFAQRAGLNEAPLSTALRLLSQTDQKQVLGLIQNAVKFGQAGPVELGGGDMGSGLTLTASRYQVEGGRTFVVAVADEDQEDEASGSAVRGVAPLIRHLVESSEKAVLVVDSFGYLRYANDALVSLFHIADASLCIGRNVAHIPNRVGKTLTSVILTTLARRAPVEGNKRFFLASGDSLTLTFSIMPFRVSSGLGGVVFSAEKVASNGIDFFHVFNAVHAPMLVIDVKTRMIVAINAAARKTFAITEQLMESAPITETMLHPKTFMSLLTHARKGGGAPMQATVSGFDGVSRSKRLRVNLVDSGGAQYLMIESKH
uniref:hypothetical protein n=1 Tax=Stappia sp. TaxID=1870903 RepID=UPI003BAB1270